VDKEFPALFGLPWKFIRPDFDRLIPNYKHVLIVNPVPHSSDIVPELRRQFPVVFSGVSRAIKDFEVTLRLKEGVSPVFVGPRGYSTAKTCTTVPGCNGER
jgi:hypothetical protein